MSKKHIMEKWPSFDERKQIVEEALKRGKRIALYCVDDLNNAPFRYRCYNTMRATQKSNYWQAVYFLKEESDFAVSVIDKSDVVIIERQTNRSGFAKKIINESRKNSKRVILDIDDLVFDTLKIGQVLKATNSKNVFYWYLYIRSISNISRLVDGFIVTNDYLGRKISNKFKKPYAIIKNSLNKEQIETTINKKWEGFRIGYFSGSPTHKKDFELIEPELVKFLQEKKDAELVIVGYMELSEELASIGERIVSMPAVDYRELQIKMSEVDVNIAPLVDNEFTNCKSELKFFEAAAAETTTIASPIFAFKNAIKHKETGFLCQQGEWYNAIEYLYNNPGENRRIAKAAKKYCLENYYGQSFLKEIEATYDFFAKRQ